MNHHGRTVSPYWIYSLLALALLCAIASSLDARTRGLILNTLELAFRSAIICLPIGLVVAWVLTRYLRQRWLLLFWIALLFTPIYLQAAGWDAAFGRQGWQTQAWGMLASPWLSGMRGAAWIHAMTNLPWVMLFLMLSLGTVDRRLEDEARLHASRFRVFTKVTLRELVPGFTAAILWCLLSAATEITATDLYQVRTYGEEIYTQADLNIGPLALISHLGIGIWLLGGIMLAAAALGLLVYPQDRYRANEQNVETVDTKKRRAGTVAMTILGAFLLAVPLGNLIYKLGSSGRWESDRFLREWSLSKATTLILSAPANFSEELTTTVFIGVCAAAAGLLFALPFAWFARQGGVKIFPGVACAALAMALPGPFIAMLVIALMNRPVPLFIYLYDETLAAPILASTVRCFPCIFFVLAYGLASVESASLEAAAIESGGHWAKLRIALGQVRSHLVIAYMCGLAITLGDLTASSPTLPPGRETISRRVFGLLHAGVDDQVAAISLIGWATFMILAIIVWSLMGRSREHNASPPQDT